MVWAVLWAGIGVVLRPRSPPPCLAGVADSGSPMVQSLMHSFGSMASVAQVAQWLNGHVASMAQWLNGSVAQWLSGSMAQWLNGSWLNDQSPITIPLPNHRNRRR